MPKARKNVDENAMVTGRTENGLQIKGRLWIEHQGETYLSWGRVVLLERINEFGSVSAAARSMGMSFSHAWQLVENMNALAPRPLVEKQAGGRQGGGAWLTEAGQEAIGEFWRLAGGFQHWIDQQHF